MSMTAKIIGAAEKRLGGPGNFKSDSLSCIFFAVCLNNTC
jgi:hypothetical protein